VLLPLSYSNAEVDPTTGLTLNATGNILNLGGGLPWSGTVTGSAGGYSGGSTPAYNPSTGNLIFGYTQKTVSQSIAISQALANAGTGIELAGYKYQWQVQNDLYNSGSNRGTLTGNVSLTGRTGNVLESFNYDYNYNLPSFTTFKGTQLFNNRYDTTSASNITVSFTGKDQNFWAGYYGPRVHVDSFSLLYTTNPCATNPAYSTTCSGFSSVVTTPELFDTSRWGSSVNQAVAINTALTNGGIGATVHGFKYSFDYSIGQSWSGCTATNQDGSCSWYMDIPASVKLTASMTNSSNQSLYQKNYSLTGDGTSGTVSGQYLLSSSLNQTALGSIRLAGSSMGTGSSLGNFSSNIMYTPDPCANNPLYSNSCTGYNAAFAKQFIPSPTQAAAPPPEAASAPPDPANPAPQPAGQGPQPAGPQLAQAGPAPADQPPGQQQPQQQGQQPPPPGPASNSPASNASPSATNPQPKPGDVQVAGSNKSSGGSSSGGGSGPSALAMSVVSNVQAKVNATEKATVQQANEAAATATAQAVQMAESVAGSAQATSIASSMSSTTTTSSSSSKTTNTQSSSGTFSIQSSAQASISSSSALKPYTPSTDSTSSVASSESSVTTLKPYTPPVLSFDNSNNSSVVPGLDIIRNNNNTSTQVAMVQPQVTSQPLQAPQQYQPPVQMYQAPAQITQPAVNYSLTEPSTFNFDTGKKQEATTVTEVEIVKNDGYKIGGQNVLNDYMSSQTYMSLQGLEQTSDGQVKRNVQPNEVAGGVDIASIATQPKGYDVYGQMTLKDASFYKVEDIYKGQTTVDNVRLLRGLQRGSDRLHQEMVDQQYKGN